MELSSRTTGRIAWLVFLLAVVAVIAAEGTLTATGRPTDLFAFMMLVFPAVGALIAARQPGNAVAWVMVGLGVVGIVSEGLLVYALYGLDIRPGSLPAADAALALGGPESPIWIFFIMLIGAFLLLLFPDGRPPSRGWRPWAWFCVAATILPFVAVILIPHEFTAEGFPGVHNPFGIAAAKDIEGALVATLLMIPIAVVGCVVALVWRFRRSRGLERVQLKWLVAAAALLGAFYGLAMITSVPFWVLGRDQPAWMEAAGSISITPIFLIPVAIGIAILRYRLYDIDVIINRSLVYGALTAILAGTYVVIVTLVGTILKGSSIVTAAATLAVAALFQPLRRRVQGFIDRRFYRRKYDAVRTVEAFSSRLREEVNLEAMRADLLGAVQQTMQPRHVSVWLRG